MLAACKAGDAEYSTEENKFASLNTCLGTMVSLSPSTQTPWYYVKLGHDRFFTTTSFTAGNFLPSNYS
jgi:hypothetical protein